MSLPRLQMISTGLLMLLLAPHLTHPRCISEDQVRTRASKYRGYWQRWNATLTTPQMRTCEEAAQNQTGDENKRSLAPWAYRINKDADRIPAEIAFAECLCRGCIINKTESPTYNSKVVYAQMLVLIRTRCSNDPDRYSVRKETIKVPVACVCIVPKY